jgi:two-component system sensor histidine kinase ResE
MEQIKLTYLDKIVHEMNASIQAIYLLSDIMLDGKLQFSEIDLQENLQHIFEASKKLIDITSMLSSITNVKSDKVVLNKEEVDLIKLIEKEIKYHQIQNKSNFHLKIFFINKISNIKAMVDQFWLEHLVSNLITNAVNHCNKGVIEISTDMFKKDDIDYFQLIISDEGSGVPENELDSIFLPLIRGSNTVGKMDGSGIGLAIVREVAEAHGGTVFARNNARGGASFEFVIPLGEYK